MFNDDDLELSECWCWPSRCCLMFMSLTAALWSIFPCCRRSGECWIGHAIDHQQVEWWEGKGKTTETPTTPAWANCHRFHVWRWVEWLISCVKNMNC